MTKRKPRAKKAKPAIVDVPPNAPKEMSAQESADFGARCAGICHDGIIKSSSLPGLDKTHWWGGFISSICGMCLGDIGKSGHDLLLTGIAKAIAANEPGKPN